MSRLRSSSCHRRSDASRPLRTRTTRVGAPRLRAAAGLRLASHPAHEIGTTPGITRKRRSPNAGHDELCVLYLEDEPERERRGVDLDEPVAVARNERKLHELGLDRRRGRGGAFVQLAWSSAICSSRASTARSRRSRAARFNSTAPRSCRRRRDVGLRLGEASVPIGELLEISAELCLARLEIGRPEPEHAFDRSSRVAKELLTAFELGDRLVKSLRMLVELAAPLREQLFEPLLCPRPGERTLRTSPLRGSSSRLWSSTLVVSIAPPPFTMPTDRS